MCSTYVPFSLMPEDLERMAKESGMFYCMSCKKTFMMKNPRSKAPKSVDVKKLFIDVLRDGTGDAIKEFHRHTLFIGAMHFMDLYNMDLERIKRCGVHYATPDGRIIPFCTYNTCVKKK